jgi:5-methylcytosine-specific restriction endonuclease McrA
LFKLQQDFGALHQRHSKEHVRACVRRTGWFGLWTDSLSRWPYRTTSWQRLRRAVLRPGARCWVDGCLKAAPDLDHIEPVALRPDLALVPSNVRPSCSHHNRSAGGTLGNQRKAGKKNPTTRSW